MNKSEMGPQCIVTNNICFHQTTDCLAWPSESFCIYSFFIFTATGYYSDFILLPIATLMITFLLQCNIAITKEIFVMTKWQAVISYLATLLERADP